jgi:ferredoxin
LAGKYREEEHDALLARFGFDDADPEEAALCPPRVVALQNRCSDLLDVLASDMPITVMLSVDRIPTRLARCHLGGAHESKAAGLALQVVNLATAYVFQSPTSELGAIARAAGCSARWPGPSLFSLYFGSDTTVRALDSYLASAIALESRAFPAFEFDPAGRTWADRFSIRENPTAVSTWGWAEIEIATAEGDEVRPAPFTFADFLACDTMYVDEFCVVTPEMWHPAMMPLDEYMALADAGNDSGALVPFLWMADESGMLHRTVVTTRVVEAARHSKTRWNTLQELGGVRSSHAERLVAEAVERLEKEKRDAIDEVARNYESELERTTGAIAQEIVSNIAAGLLGLQSNLSRRPISSDQSLTMPAAAPESREVEETVELPENVVSDVDDNADDNGDDEVITLDDPYIETVRCTTCNECTNINDRLFAYNENQQAYIKDAAAGSYHELVVAAEMCPVKIIHPGKPLNPDEPRLAELIERAKPYK